MSVAMNVTSLRSQAGAEALRLAADAKDTYRAGALLLRGSPFAVGWFAGWLSTEFPPQVVTGHALSRVSRHELAPRGPRNERTRTLTAALEESFGPDFRDQVCHPTCDAGRMRAPQRPVAHARAAPPVRGADFRHLLRSAVARNTCSTSGGVTIWRPAAARRC